MATMKCVRYHAPGGPEKLIYGDESKPSVPGEGQVLIKVRAIGLIWTELYWPIYQDVDGQYITHIPGHDFSGIVEGMGPGCEDSGLEVGAEVMAFSSRRNHEGAMAEFATVDADQVVRKPAHLSFADAATVPLSALTAWQALFVHGNLQRGQKLLITAAAGGTGVFAVQFAKEVGASVVATASSAQSEEILRSLGADEVINYKTTNLETAVNDVDLVLECVGDKSLDQCLKVVKDGGRVVSICSWDAEAKAKEFGISGKFFIVNMDALQLKEINHKLEAGKTRTVLDKTFPLEKASDAFVEASSGHVHGKIVITVP